MNQYLTERINKTNTCWLWTGSMHKDGYGQALYNGRVHGAHRAVWLDLGNEIPNKMTLDHQCDKKHCVNPKHLKIATQRDNILGSNGPSAKNARKTHCKHGHPFDKKNTYILKSRGWRVCRKCRNQWLYNNRK